MTIPDAAAPEPARFPLPPAPLARFLHAMEALRDPVRRADLLHGNAVLPALCRSVLTLLDDPEFQVLVAQPPEGGPAGGARRLDLARRLRARYPDEVALLEERFRAQAWDWGPGGEAPADGDFERHPAAIEVTVHEFTTVYIFPLGAPEGAGFTAPPAGPGPSPWLRPRVLSLITTHRCTAACEHCCFSCSPARAEAIPVPRLHALVAETAEVPSIALVVFTGGECFLLGRHLDDLLRRCRQRGLRTRCVSNGSWAASPAVAEARAEALAAAGLDELNLSTGPFHARFVPPERIVWAVKACAARGIRTLVNLELFAGADFPEALLTADPELLDLRRDRRLVLNRACWVPNGDELWTCAAGGRSTAAPLAHPEPALRFRQPVRTACGSSLAVLSVNPDQELISCCGLNLEQIPALHLCSLKDQTLGQALRGLQPDLLKLWIHAEGPERILEFLRERDPGLELPLDSAHICHTCQYLHRNPRAQAALRAHAGEVTERVLERFVLDAAALEWAGGVGLEASRAGRFGI